MNAVKKIPEATRRSLEHTANCLLMSQKHGDPCETVAFANQIKHCLSCLVDLGDITEQDAKDLGVYYSTRKRRF